MAIITGTEGNDTLVGTTDNDEISGGGGDDSLTARNGDYDLVIIQGGAGNDTIIGAAGESTLDGGDGNDFITATGGTSSLFGDAGNDTLVGASGFFSINDFDGGTGADSMRGGTGLDTYVVDDAGDIVDEDGASSGGDWVHVGLAAYTAPTGIEVLEASLDVATSLTGNTLNNRLIGALGDDTLDGLAGNDKLEGKAGADVLSGGTGKDTLVGATGTDLFVFDTTLNAKSNVDRVVDFVAADDQLMLDNAVFTALAPGALAKGAFVAGKAAQDGGDRLIYNKATGQLYYDADGTGSKAKVLFADFADGTRLTFADIQVV